MSLIQTINRLSQTKLGRLPDWECPKGYNDKIHWLKVHDQRPEHVIACDKIAVRKMVAEIVGEGVLVPFHDGETYPCIIKTNHDSGGNRLAHTYQAMELAKNTLRPRLARKYGVDKGEWAYALIEPEIFVEAALPEPVIDYKFHCVHGQVKWVQVIWDRKTKPKEAIFSPAGRILPLHMDEKMIHAPHQSRYPGLEAWNAMRTVAEKLAESWRYVRVDLYWSQERVRFGEMTFWPRAGCYKSKDQPVFGEMLEIDLSERFQPLVQ